MKSKPEPRDVKIVHPSYQPNRAELREDLRMGSRWDDFEQAAKALVRPARVRYVKQPERGRS
ncbi:MAG: hypothetical protein OXN97_17835 [Bryobacterales bacterium]|nr:hypothetical protein [Bryobacterales bacterium]